MKRLHAILILLAALLFLYGCAEPQDSGYVVDTGPTGEITQYGDYAPDSGTVIGSMVDEWRLFSVIFLLISIGLIAMAYPVSSALNLRELRAWADVEMGEAVSTALVVGLVIGVLVFVELVTQAYTLATPQFNCDGSRFCPVSVAEQYLQEYMDTTMPLYGDLLQESVAYGKAGTLSLIAGTNFMYLGYLSVTMKPMPFFLIQATSATQKLQFLMGMRDILFIQQFLLNHVSATLAPMALLLGIIFRSFFITRKLGGLLMAFGIGFMLVFPATYALAMYTLDVTINGASVTGGEVTNEHCTANCRVLPPVAYVPSEEEGLTRSDIEEFFPIEDLFPQDGDESDEDYEARLETLGDEYLVEINKFIRGRECTLVEVPQLPLPARIDEVCTPIEYWDTSGGERIYSCGFYEEKCPQLCRTLPYPNQNMDCASRETEFYCREHVPEQCFLTRYVDFGDPNLQGMADEDTGIGDDVCPDECRPLIGLKKEGCDVGYGFILESPEMEASDIEDIMQEEGYSSKPGVESANDFYRTDKHGDYRSNRGPGSDAKKFLSVLGFEELEFGKMVIWDEGCPNHCRWISTDGTLMDPGCDTICKQNDEYIPEDPQEIWDEAYDAYLDGSVEDQIEAAEKSCVMIIPNKVFNSPECTSCSYLLDPGFASYPAVHLSCEELCGSPKSATADNGMESELAEMDSVAAITFPALILPMLNIVITMIAIRTISPILGGDIDLPGMMRLIR
jgi:hypothetical protein